MRHLSISKIILSITGMAVLLTFMTISCSSPTDVDCGPFPDKFRVTDFSTSIKQVTDYDPVDLIIQLSVFPGGSIQYDELAIDMIPVIDTFFSSVPNRMNFQLIQSAYACSPVIPVSVDTITDIQIYSDADFSPEYPAGENIAVFFDAFALYNEDGPMRMNLPQYIAGEPLAPDQLILLLNTAPAEEREMRFSVRYFQDGESLGEYEFTSNPITVVP
ncbi:MAG: DUF5034 domain-containing protein [Balneolia bacterium]|nr:DUF5034 domain-containing protein [Balneolia bacterium]